ncbi:uncharacterized protein LOC119070784 [Bradysia coprophila]|uniref:uncharacterized protein LOC119070784 n=1 Tax=Bradysia coprophila TaxID=38358 RepID=UPI00187D6F00|nr:uncharacterized protein LOC119070784 [Bradysia coprophila]
MNFEKNKANLLSASDDVLLHIFKYLNWIDSINLAVTCKRMKSVQYYLQKQNQKFDLAKCVKKVTVPIENVLSEIGPHIRVAKIDESAIHTTFVKKCLNIKSLEIDGSIIISKNVAITLNAWIKKLHIDSLSMGQGFEDCVEDILDGITGLNSFAFDSFDKLLPTDFFYKNSNIEHLLLVMGNDAELALDLSSLHVLHNLHSLSLTTQKTAVLDDVREYLKVDQLKEFSIYMLDDNWDADTWEDFANYLAKNTKLDKLRIIGSVEFDTKTFSQLKLFNLTSLWLDVRFSWDDLSTALYESTALRLKYLRLEWPLSWCNSRRIGCIFKMWTTVEVVCFGTNDTSDLLHHFNDRFFSDILNLSNNRPALKLHIFSSEICFNFILKRYHVIEGRECCSCKDSFQFSLESSSCT